MNRANNLPVGLFYQKFKEHVIIRQPLINYAENFFPFTRGSETSLHKSTKKKQKEEETKNERANQAQSETFALTVNVTICVATG